MSMSPHDIVTGRRKCILSLFYQLMRFHTMQVLQGIAAPESASGSGDRSSRGSGSGGGSSTGHTFRSSSRKQAKQQVTEQDVLAWANSKLARVTPLWAAGSSGDGEAAAAAAGGANVEAPRISSFRDAALSRGVVLLQLLHVLASDMGLPGVVDYHHVTRGETREQRASNARYALAVADRLGVSLFVVWEDMVDPAPRISLVLLASLMAMDYREARRRAAGFVDD